MFCIHKWKPISKHITDSTFELMIKQGFNPSEASPAMFEKQQVVLLRCSLCGDLKQKTFDTSVIIHIETETK